MTVLKNIYLTRITIILVLSSVTLLTIGIISWNNIKNNYKTIKTTEKKSTLNENILSGVTAFEETITRLQNQSREKKELHPVQFEHTTKTEQYSHGKVKTVLKPYTISSESNIVTSTEIVHPLLDRRKRYLIFPESSSFQLIFDLIIGVVDYTKYAILGITVAVAWELPSKPPSEILEEVTQRIKNGTLGFSRRNDSDDTINLLYGDKNTNFYSKMSFAPTNNHYYNKDLLHSYIPQGPQGDNFYRTPQNSYLEKNADYMYDNSQEDTYAQNNDKTEPFYYKTPYYNRSNWQQLKTQKWQKYNNYWPHRNFDYSRFNEKTPDYRILKPSPTNGRFDEARKNNAFRKHYIYPIYKKRRFKRDKISDLELKMDEIHEREHLLSRNKLYTKLESAFQKAGHNGTACILRALCETAKMNHAHKSSEPQDFIQEILRAVFTLPTSNRRKKRNINKTDNTTHDYGNHIINEQYLEAFTVHNDCGRIYEHCSHSIWNNAPGL